MDEKHGIQRYCRKCGKALNESDEAYCSQCQVEIAEENIDDPREEVLEELSSGEKRESRVKLAVLIVVLLVAVGVIIYRIPAFTAALEDDQPIRKGTYETDAGTDRCISNLWVISKMLGDGDLPDSSIVCPESGKPYTVVEDAVNTTVFCPNPREHGLMEIRVSKMFPCPEVKQ